MTIEHSILTYLKGKDFVAGGTLERELSDSLRVKPATINRTLRLMKGLEMDKTRLPRRAVSYRHRCEGNCWDVQDNKTKEIYHKFK